MTVATVYIGLGSNLNEPVNQLDKAVAALDKIKNTQLLRVSSYYQSAPVGPDGQDDYINAVAQLETQLPAVVLLQQLQQIENSQGRVRTEHWGARTLDLDMLLYDDSVIKTEKLTVPHPYIEQRNFVLLPLMEITSEEFKVPDKGALIDLLSTCPDNPIEKMIRSS